MDFLAQWKAALRAFLAENEAAHARYRGGWSRYVQDLYLADSGEAGTDAPPRRQRWQDYEKV